ncbi:hypothetical protein ACTXOJ_11285 [Glutamicibacter arilaitensis]|uniref:hypothetical protein n=1 Tax=Glutamicibacter arilaitensis TaxID=256701 RepID=UPI003FD1F380
MVKEPCKIVASIPAFFAGRVVARFVNPVAGPPGEIDLLTGHYRLGDGEVSADDADYGLTWPPSIQNRITVSILRTLNPKLV